MMAKPRKLDQYCVRPGHWRIENHDVIRSPEWHSWDVFFGDTYISQLSARTLLQVRQKFRDEILRTEAAPPTS